MSNFDSFKIKNPAYEAVQKIQNSGAIAAARKIQESTAFAAAMKMETSGAFAAVRELQKTLEATRAPLNGVTAMIEEYQKTLEPIRESMNLMHTTYAPIFEATRTFNSLNMKGLVAGLKTSMPVITAISKMDLVGFASIVDSLPKYDFLSTISTDNFSVEEAKKLFDEGEITQQDVNEELVDIITKKKFSPLAEWDKFQKSKWFIAVQLLFWIVNFVFSPVIDYTKDKALDTFGITEFWNETGIYEYIDEFFESFNKETLTEEEAKQTVDTSKTGNISKQKREDLLAKIKEIRTFISAAPQDENTGNLLSYLSELEKDVNGKKYGLVFEEHREEIDEVLDTHTPVLTEDKDLFIDNGGQMNFLIEGDNLASLKLLEKTHKGKIDLIYIDPPYNTGQQDFIYNDEYISSEDLFKHSQWLSFIEKRLQIAKHILKSNGCIFMSIDNNEFAQLKLLADKVFGDENFVTSIHVEMSATQGMKVKAAKQGNIVKNGEYILVYKMDGTKNVGYTPLTDPVKYDAHYNSFLIKEENYYSEITLSQALKKETEIIDALRLLGFLDKKGNLPNKNISDAYDKCDAFKMWINNNATKICRAHDSINVGDMQKNKMIVDKVYEYSSDTRKYLICKNKKNEVYQRILLSEKLSVADDFYNTYGPTRIRGDWWSGFYLDMGNISKEGNVEFLNGKKPKRLIKQIVKFASRNKNEIILDFFAGSGTTGHAIMELNCEDKGNRSFILCTNNENNICREKTYNRLNGVINKEGYEASLKYYKVDYIPVSERMYYEYADELLRHIRELVELENGVNFTNNAEIAIVLTEEELEDFISNIEDFSKCKKLYMGHDLLPTEEQEQSISSHEIEVNIIPDYYYRDLQEN